MSGTTAISEGVTGLAPMLTRPILFGHQSVGANILTGISEGGHNVSITGLTPPYDAKLMPGINHWRLGRNGDPLSKLEEFHALLRVCGDRCALALMKFCYVDITRETKPQELFSRYLEELGKSHKRFPSLRIAHVTVPLQTLGHGFRSRLARVGRLKSTACEANFVRERFNHLMRERFAAEGFLFDLAALESRLPHGDLCAVPYRGRVVPGLNSAYASDDGHLNLAGRAIIAERFLRFLGLVTVGRDQ